MDERELITRLGGPEKAWDVCTAVVNVVKSLRAHRRVPVGDVPLQFDAAIKYGMGRGRVPWEAGEALLSDLSLRTVQAINRVAGSKRELAKAWLLEGGKEGSG